MVTVGTGSGPTTWKTPVVAATTGPLPANSLTGTTLTANANGALVIDGVTVPLGARVLVANEGAAANNGLYLVTATGSSSAKWQLGRAGDLNTGSQVPGTVVLVSQGSVNVGLLFAILAPGPYTVGATPIRWVRSTLARTGISPAAFGAVGNGTTDDTAALNAALAAAQQSGEPVLLDAVTYGISSALTIPSGVSVIGPAAMNPVYFGDVSAVIKPLPSFSGGAVIVLATPAHTQTPGVALRHFAIDGSAVTGGLDGIFAQGPMYLVRLEDLWITGCDGWGIQTAQDTAVSSGASWPFWWWVRDVMVENCATGGISLTSMTDSTWANTYVIQCGGTSGHGWVIDWAGNSQFTNCRAEWSGGYGFYLTGSWWTGTGAGGCTFTGCSTDRNNWDGVKIDATGNGPVLFDNLMLRRDGRNNKTGGGSFSGFNIAAATIPVTVGTISVFPGVDDDGTGVNSPQFGISISGSSVVAAIGAGYVQAATQALNDTHSGALFTIGAGMITATGTPAAPGSYSGQTAYGALTFQGSSQTFNGGPIFCQDAVDIYTAGQGLKVAEGSNAKQGTVTLNGTTAVVVSNTSVTANSRIFLSVQSPGGVTPGTPYVSARTAGTSFSVTSTVASDNSVVAYEIFEPG